MVLKEEKCKKHNQLSELIKNNADFWKSHGLVFLAATATADYVDPETKECFLADDVEAGRKGLIPLPNVNELELLQSYVKKQLTWDRSLQKNLLRSIHEAMQVENQSLRHRNQDYDSYSAQGRACIHSIESYFDSHGLYVDWDNFREKEMFRIAKAWYEEHELWGK